MRWIALVLVLMSLSFSLIGCGSAHNVEQTIPVATAHCCKK